MNKFALASSKRNAWFLAQIVALAMVAILATGCAGLGKTLRNFISGRDSSENGPPRSSGATRFSDNENVRSPNDRQYKRMNRQKFEEEAELKADAGSLWVMEGQGAYLFSQNQIRMVGDLLNVKIEGAPKSQLQTKVKVISKLLERLENPGRGLASTGQPGGAGQSAANGQNGQQGTNQQGPNGAANANPDGTQNTAAGAAQPGADPNAAKEAPFAVQAVPTRIVEQLKDGSYRVRGMQPFMIGKREYKVIVTGVIRPEDFDDAGVDASRLLDPQFDIVSSKKGATL
jgi:flagellar L-ring protein precursor FlgH